MLVPRPPADADRRPLADRLRLRAGDPHKVAMEVASLAPNAEVTMYPWKDSQEHIDAVVEHARRFLKAHEPVTA